MNSVQYLKTTVFDKEWRRKHLYIIRDKEKNRISFAPNYTQQIIDQKINTYQKECQKLQKKTRICILKARQLGVTTGFCVDYVDRSNFDHDQLIAIMAHRREEVGVIFQDYVKFVYDNMKLEKMKVPPKYDTRTFLSLKNQSTIAVMMDVHGLTPNVLHITEASRINNASNRIEEAMQAVPSSGTVVMESTANGIGGFFYETVSRCMKNDPTWQFIFVTWYHNPGYRLVVENKYEFQENLDEEEAGLVKKFKLDIEQIAWRRDTISELGNDRIDIKTGLNGKQLFKQNYPTTPQEAFITASGQLIDNDILQRLVKNVRKPKYIDRIKMGTFYCYKKRNNHMYYILAADPAEGIGGDPSAAILLGYEPLDAIPTFCGLLHGQYPPRVFAKVLLKLAKHFNNALIAVERNNHGHAVLNQIYNDDRYHYLYYHRKWDKTGKSTDRPGFPTEETTRAIALSDLQDIIENGFEIPDEICVNELLAFKYIDGKAQAMTGCHDDTVLAGAIGVYVWKTKRKRALTLPRTKPAGL